MATGYHLMAWRLIVQESFGHQTFYLMAKDHDGEVRGVLPLVFLVSRFFGRFLVSMPFVNYGGLLVDTPEAQGALLQEAIRLAMDLKASHIELRQQASLDVDWPSKQRKISMRLKLHHQFHLIWKQFPSKLRSQIHRAKKEAMTVRIGGRDILNDFYLVFSRNMRDLGTPVYGRNFFETILRVLSKDAKICAVYWKDQPLAAGLLYGFRNLLEIPWASSDQRYNRLAPNMLLYNSVIEHACEEGFKEFDFGRSTRGSGTYRFKEQWGARPVPLSWHYWVSNGGQMPEINPQNPKYGMAIKIWQKLPITLTKIIGPHIVKNIP